MENYGMMSVKNRFVKTLMKPVLSMMIVGGHYERLHKDCLVFGRTTEGDRQGASAPDCKQQQEPIHRGRRSAHTQDDGNIGLAG
jgi:hypothetical protein